MVTLETIEQALKLENFDVLNAHGKMAPSPRNAVRPEAQAGTARLSAVMLLLFPSQVNELSFVLMQRPEYGGAHSGQISFPGGKKENHDKSMLQTALRETQEEVGVHPEQINLIGELTPIYIPPSDFQVHPFVGYVSQKPTWQPDPIEVAGIIEMPIMSLLDDTIKKAEPWTFKNSFTLDVHFYHFQDYKIWGATAIMLSEFEQRVKTILNGYG